MTNELPEAQVSKTAGRPHDIEAAKREWFIADLLFGHAVPAAPQPKSKASNPFVRAQWVSIFTDAKLRYFSLDSPCSIFEIFTSASRLEE